MPPFMRAQLEPDVNTYANRWTPDKLPGLAVSYEFQRQLVKALSDGGVPILAGTDASWLGVPGFCLLEEVENFQDLGLTPYAALKTATVDPAKLLRREGEFGTIAVGKRADLILTRQNPLEDVRRLRQPDGVMANGRWIDAAERRRLLEGLPASYRDTLAKLTREARQNPKALDAYLEANDPWGEIGGAVLGGIASDRGPAGLVGAAPRHPPDRSEVAAPRRRSDQPARVQPGRERRRPTLRSRSSSSTPSSTRRRATRTTASPRPVSARATRSSPGSTTRAPSRSSRTIRTRRRPARSSRRSWPVPPRPLTETARSPAGPSGRAATARRAGENVEKPRRLVPRLRPEARRQPVPRRTGLARGRPARRPGGTARRSSPIRA